MVGILSLQGRIAVVTGASSGIGLAITRLLLHDGVKVAGLARRLEVMQKFRKNLPPKECENFLPVKCDIGKVESVKSAFSKISEAHNSVDILICNAGSMFKGRILDCNNEKELKKTMDVNLLGTIFCIKEAYPLLKQAMECKRPTHVITVGSLLDHYVPPHIAKAGFNLYPVAKHALRAAHEVLRREFEVDELLSLSNISPGLVNTGFIPKGIKLPDKRLAPEDIAIGMLFMLQAPPHVNVTQMTMLPSDEHY